jgi:hypothetical protein
MRQLNEQIAMLVEESAARRRKRQSSSHTQVYHSIIVGLYIFWYHLHIQITGHL